MSNNELIITTLVFKDMMYYIKIWRLIRGYNSNGQRSHSNNKGTKKHKLVNTFRLQQFYRQFGRKKRDIFPTLILAEYNNRLWYIMWYLEWLEGKLFMFKLIERGKNRVKFDPQLLSKNIVTGLKKTKKKKKHNVAKKKILLVATIGLPVPFTPFLYNYNNKHKLPFTLYIPDAARRKMGKKKKKKK